jgi:hypothetical protein
MAVYPQALATNLDNGVHFSSAAVLRVEMGAVFVFRFAVSPSLSHVSRS